MGGIWTCRELVGKQMEPPTRSETKYRAPIEGHNKGYTLREGEETPNVNMSLEDKLTIARLLSEVGSESGCGVRRNGRERSKTYRRLREMG